MGKVNVWLKRSYTIAASLIGVSAFLWLMASTESAAEAQWKRTEEGFKLAGELYFTENTKVDPQWRTGNHQYTTQFLILSYSALSALLLAFTLFSHGYFHEDEEIEKVLTGLHTMYTISILTLLFTIVGVFGACKEKKWALILFAVGMILSSLFMFGCEISALAAQPQMAKEMEKHYLEMVRLTNSSEKFLEGFEEAQIELQCCGLDRGYLDWGYNIPESCMCDEESTNPCVAAPRNSSLFERHTGDEPIMIYKEPCLQYIIKHALSVLNVGLGVILGVTLLWVLAVALCIVILCQLSQKVDTPTVVYSQEAKAGNYAILAEPVDLT